MYLDTRDPTRYVERLIGPKAGKHGGGSHYGPARKRDLLSKALVRYVEHGAAPDGD